MKRSPLKPSTKPMSRSMPMARAAAEKAMSKESYLFKRSAPMKTRRKVRPKIDGIDYLAMCRGQECFLLLPMVRFHNRETVVPCHSNQSKHGKGMGLKANDRFTVPGCAQCHFEIDQGKTLSRQERRDVWDAAYARWDSYREKQFNHQGV